LHAQRFAQQRMLHLVQRIGQFGMGVFEMVFALVEILMDDGETVLGDAAGQHRAALAAVENGDVGAAPGKADAKRSTGNDHDVSPARAMTAFTASCTVSNSASGAGAASEPPG